MAKKELITIRYNNDSDIQSHVFQNGMFYDLLLCGVIGEPQYEHSEYVNESSDKEIEYTRKILKKTLTLIVLGGEHLADVLNFIKVCNNIAITNKANEVFTVNEMTVETPLTDQAINIFKLKFVILNISNSICTNNNTLNDGLFNPHINIIDIIDSGDPKYSDPSGYPVGSFVAVNFSGDLKLLQRTNDSKTLWQDAEGLTETQYYKYGDNVYYQLQQFTNNSLLPLPYIYLESSDGDTRTIMGQGLQGYMLSFEYETTGTGDWGGLEITGTGQRNVSCLVFNGSGITASVKAGDSIRCFLASLDDPTTVLTYSNEIDIT